MYYNIYNSMLGFNDLEIELYVLLRAEELVARMPIKSQEGRYMAIIMLLNLM